MTLTGQTCLSVTLSTTNPAWTVFILNRALRCERLNTQDVLVGCFFCFVSACSGTYTALQCYNCDLLCKIALKKHRPSFLVSKFKKNRSCVCLCEQHTNCYGIITVLLYRYTNCCHLPMCRPHSVRHVTHTCQVEYIEFLQRFQDGT